MRRTIFSIAALGLLLGYAGQAAAAIMNPGFAGNTQPMFAPSTQGYVNFAVYDRTGGTATDSFGTGFAAMDAALTAGTNTFNTASNYLYLYQVSDVNPIGADIVSTSHGPVAAADVTGMGILGALGFSDVGGPVTALNPFGTGAAAGNPSAASLGVTTPSIVAFAGIGPNSVSTVSGTSFVASWTVVALGPNLTSSLYGFTSNLPPIILNTSIQDGGVAANGHAPVPNPNQNDVPEPASVVVWSLLGLIIGTAGWWRRRFRHE